MRLIGGGGGAFSFPENILADDHTQSYSPFHATLST